MSITAPSTSPGTTPPPAEIVFDDVKNQTERELLKLKNQLGVIDTDPNHTAEWEKIKAVFQEKKDTIKKISAVEIAELKAEIQDINNELPGNLEVSAEGDIKYNNAPAPSPEVTPPPPTSTEVAAAVAFFKEEGEFVETNTEPKETLGSRIGKYIKNALSGFFMSLKEMFGQDVSNEKAQIEGYKDALSKKKVEGMMSGLSPYVGGALDNASITKKEGLSKYIEGTGVPLVYISENGKQQIMIAPQVMKYVFEGKNPDNKLQNIIKNDETWANIQAVRGKYLSFGGDHSSLADISATDRVKEIFTIEEGQRQDYIERANESVPVVPDDLPSIPGVVPVPGVAPAESSPTSPEAQASKLNEAQKADRDLEEAKRISPETEESKKKIIEAQNKVDEIKNRERDIILGTLSETENTLNDLTNRLTVLKAQNETIPPELLTKIAAYTTAIKNIKENIVGNNAVLPILAIGELASDGKTYKILPAIGSESVLKANIAIQSIKDKLNPKISTELNSEKEKTEKEKIKQISNKLSVIFIVPPSIIKDAQKLVDAYQENPSFKEEITLLNKNIDAAKAKIDLVTIAVQKKQQMANENRFIKWDNNDENIHRGWVEIDGKEDADGSCLEFDVDGYFKVDWQLIRGDSPLVKKLGGLKKCRDILIANKNTIMNTTNTSSLQY